MFSAFSHVFLLRECELGEEEKGERCIYGKREYRRGKKPAANSDCVCGGGEAAAAAKNHGRGSLSLMTCNACDTGGDGDGKATKTGKGGKPRGFFCCNLRPLRR